LILLFVSTMLLFFAITPVPVTAGLSGGPPNL